MNLNKISTVQSSHLKRWKKSEGPVFIIEINSRKICEVSPEVIATNSKINPVGKKLDDIIHIEKNLGSADTPAYFNNQWYHLEQEILIWKDRPCVKVSLKQRTDIPDLSVIDSLKKMIEILVHHLRSPLTAIQGYAYLIENDTANHANGRHLGQINKGVNQISGLLNEIERFRDIPSDTVDVNNLSASSTDVVHSLLSGYPADITQRIKFTAPDDCHIIRSNQGDLRRTLSLLLDNAIQHSDAMKDKITVDFPSPYSIRITHDGTPIPKAIERELFFPFVTSGAQNLGIGLTLAMLYARRYRGSIFLTENKPYKGVSFVLCFPPASDWNASSSAVASTHQAI